MYNGMFNQSIEDIISFRIYDSYFHHDVRGHGAGVTLPISMRMDFFLCPRDDSQGALRFAPVCLSVRLSVCHTLWYRVCVINSSHSF